MKRLNWPVAPAVLATAAFALALSGCHGKSADYYISAGDTAVEAQKLEEAEGDYKQAVDIAPNDPRPHVSLGNLYVLEHKDAPAQSEFMRVLELDPKNAPSHAALGNLYNDQAQYPPAEAQFRAALAIDPTRSNYHSDLGTVLAKEGKPADAQTEFKTAIGFDPKNAQAHYQLGNLLSTTPGHETEAQAEYDQAKQLDPKLTPPVAATPPAASAPATSITGGPSTAPAKVKPIEPPKLFKLTHESPVFTNPDPNSTVVGNVHIKKYVRVIGISGSWLQIRLKDGTVGFIPTTAAE
jgi:tetratricopeptide (TPR) repeat protein